MTELQKNNKDRFQNYNRAWIQLLNGDIKRVVILSDYAMGSLPKLDTYVNMIDENYNSFYNYRIDRIISY